MFVFALTIQDGRPQGRGRGRRAPPGLVAAVTSVVSLVNAPIGIIVLLVAARLVPATRSPHPFGVDLPGTVLFAATLTALLAPLTEGHSLGWPLWTWLLIAIAVLLGAVTFVVEKEGRGAGRGAAAATLAAAAAVDVPREDRAPRGAGDVGADQQPADNLADDRGDAGGRAVQGQRAGLALALQRVVEGGQHLRDEQRGGGALDDPRRDEEPGRRREAAGQRGQHEPHEPAQEDPVAAVAVPQPATQDQQGRVRHPVPGGHQLLSR